MAISKCVCTYATASNGNSLERSGNVFSVLSVGCRAEDITEVSTICAANISYADLFEIDTTGECAKSNGLNAFGNVERYYIAVSKCTGTDLTDSVRNNYYCIGSDIGIKYLYSVLFDYYKSCHITVDAGAHVGVGNNLVGVECYLTVGGRALNYSDRTIFINNYDFKLYTALERTASDLTYGRRNRYTNEVRAILECGFGDHNHARRNFEGGHMLTVLESRNADNGERRIFSECNTLNSGALECRLTKLGKTCGNLERCQSRTARKCGLLD